MSSLETGALKFAILLSLSGFSLYPPTRIRAQRAHTTQRSSS